MKKAVDNILYQHYVDYYDTKASGPRNFQLDCKWGQPVLHLSI